MHRTLTETELTVTLSSNKNSAMTSLSAALASESRTAEEDELVRPSPLLFRPKETQFRLI